MRLTLIAVVAVGLLIAASPSFAQPAGTLCPDNGAFDNGCDGFIGIVELNLVLGNWNQDVTPGDHFAGDASGDGFVGIDDLNIVLGNWNNGTPPPLSASDTSDQDADDCFPEDPLCGGGGFFGIAELNRVLGAWNQTVPPADPLADWSGDGYIGIADLNVVLGNWNAGTPPAAVPETGTLAVLGLLGLLPLRRQYRR